MSHLKLSLAMEHYDRSYPLLEGRVMPEGIDLQPMVVSQSTGERHERMLNHREFDVCELSLSSYLMAKAQGAPLTAIPVFPRRLFSQPQMFVNTHTGIRAPADLVGKKVGLGTYQTTLSVLAKGDLQYEYELPLEKVTWVTTREEPVPFDPPEGIRIEQLKPGQDMDDLLVQGEIQALMIPRTPESFLRGDSNVARLFSDPKAEVKAHFERNGFFPIMHTIALKEEVLEENPWVARHLLDAFEQSKEICYHYYDDPNWSQLVWGRLLFEEERRVFGPDPWPNGVSANRKNLERFIQYSYTQGLIPQKLTVEELFAETTLET